LVDARCVREVFLVLVFVFLLAIAAILVAAGVVAIGRGRQFNDVERFHRARGITTGWARSAMTRPVVGEQKRPPSASRRSQQRESADV
jgi:hypothetical protein